MFLSGYKLILEFCGEGNINLESYPMIWQSTFKYPHTFLKVNTENVINIVLKLD
jgi:hypothetical protein